MSIEQMTQVWKLELSHSKQSLLLALADHAHDDGTKCHPGVGYLAWKTGYSVRQVKRILADLEEDKIIKAQGEKIGGRGHATEYHLHLEKGVKKSPYRTTVKGDISTQKDDMETPLDSEKGDIDDIKGDNGDTKGDIAVSPQPSEPSVESSSTPGAAGKKKGRKDRSKPAPPDHKAKVDAFLEANEDLADEILEFIARGASKNSSGEMTYSRQWRAFVLPVELSLQEGADRGAVLYALQEANRKNARDMRYFETVLENNPDGRPRRRTSSHGRGSSSATPPAPEISGKNGAARRREGYEWLFGEDDSEEETPGPRETREDRRRREENERRLAEVAYGQRLKLAETEMRKWRSGMNDQTYQLRVTRLKRAHEKNGLDVEDIERLDEEIRSEYAQRKAG